MALSDIIGLTFVVRVEVWDGSRKGYREGNRMGFRLGSTGAEAVNIPYRFAALSTFC